VGKNQKERAEGMKAREKAADPRRNIITEKKPPFKFKPQNCVAVGT